MNKIIIQNTHELDEKIDALFQGVTSVCEGCVLCYSGNKTLFVDAYLNSHKATPDECDETMARRVINDARQCLDNLKNAHGGFASRVDDGQVILRCIYMDWMKPVEVAEEFAGQFKMLIHQ